MSTLAAASDGVLMRPIIQNIATRPAAKNSCCKPDGMDTLIRDAVSARVARRRRNPSLRTCLKPR